MEVVLERATNREAWPAPADPCPAPGSPEELHRFAELQARLEPLFQRAFPDPLSCQTVVVVPSMTLDAAELRKLSAAAHYEERLLCLLLLLRRPRTQVVYLTSQPIAPAIVDYYLHLLAGVPMGHARKRLTLLSCHDSSPASLTEKLLARPRLLERVREAIPDPWAAHMTCFNATELERTLAVRLGIPLYAPDPALRHLGTKSGSRRVFREAGIAFPDGFEDLRDARDVARALAALKRRRPGLRRAAIKLNDGFSGEGNALFSFAGAPGGAALDRWVEAELADRARFEAPGESWEPYREKLGQMGGVVEEFVEGREKRSPSVQCRVAPTRQISVISSHDQVLGGPTGQVFQGCTFPADPDYALPLHHDATRVAEVLRDQGVVGRFGIDFVLARRDGRWERSAIEINLRKGGTTHPYLMLQYLTDGEYDPGTGTYRTLTGQPCCYYASDNLADPAYRGLCPDDLIDIAVTHRLHFHGATQQGVVFHLIGALSEHGKLGAMGIAGTREDAARLFRETVAVLQREVRAGARA